MIEWSSQTVAYGAVCLLCILLVKQLLSRRPPLPPGPKGWPIIGNALDVPQGEQWVEYARWAERWGGIIYLNLFGQPAMVINDADTAIAMLDKKSAIYSDRPELIVARMANHSNGTALTHYNDRLRESRRMIHRYIGTRSSIDQLHDIEERETHRLLRRILERPEPECIPEHIRLTAGAIIFMITHGYAAKEKDDYFVHLTDVVLSNFVEAVTPGRFLVDTFPILRYVPEWMPGMAWKRMVLAEWQKTMQENLDLPHEYVKQQMKSGTAVPSFTSAYLEKTNLTEDKEDLLKWTAQSMMGGGADTTVCASYVFFLAMVLHPEAQKKAQQELDSVIGPDRLPTLKARSQLPYIDAIVKEVLRWHPVAPLGLPHRLMEDDIQDGYLIPKGSLILHDEETYKNPSEFRPERFLAPEKQQPEKDPRGFAFGFGRRICPGLLLADASLFLTCAMVLSVFNISKAVENGVPITPKEEFINGAINHPKVFKCSIKSRSEQAVSIIKSVDFVGE